MTRIVVDASVAVCCLTREGETCAANQLLRKRVNLISPSLILAEFANTIWKKERRGEMGKDQTTIALRKAHRSCPKSWRWESGSRRPTRWRA